MLFKTKFEKVKEHYFLQNYVFEKAHGSKNLLYDLECQFILKLRGKMGNEKYVPVFPKNLERYLFGNIEYIRNIKNVKFLMIFHVQIIRIKNKSLKDLLFVSIFFLLGLSPIVNYLTLKINLFKPLT